MIRTGHGTSRYLHIVRGSGDLHKRAAADTIGFLFEKISMPSVSARGDATIQPPLILSFKRLLCSCCLCVTLRSRLKELNLPILLPDSFRRLIYLTGGLYCVPESEQISGHDSKTTFLLGMTEALALPIETCFEHLPKKDPRRDPMRRLSRTRSFGATGGKVECGAAHPNAGGPPRWVSQIGRSCFDDGRIFATPRRNKIAEGGRSF